MRGYGYMKVCETGAMETGYLRVDVVNEENNFPIEGADVRITYEDGSLPEEVVKTNNSGQTEPIALRTPPVALSLQAGDVKPYADYNVTITAPGFEPLSIEGTEVLSGVTAIQPARLIPLADEQGQKENINIPDHTLYGVYPPKIAEDEIKPPNESGEIVLSRVVVPQTVIVHDGVPTDASAKDYYVPYRDYIKNVASSEIYATWPQATIVANVLAIMSFTLNRVYTEWYRDMYKFSIINY